MENVEIAGYLEDVADLLEIQEANPFRIRAFRNAARTVEEHTTQLRKLVAEEANLTELPAIGKGIAGDIEELLKTGTMTILEELTKEIPYSLIQLTRLSGVGPKRARALWKLLGVETIDELEEVATSGEVAELKGFGAKTQDRILRGIATYRKHLLRFRLADAEQLVEPLIEYLTQDAAVERIEVAGSYRRRKETVGDIDLLVIAREPQNVMRRYAEYPQVDKVEIAGDTKGTVFLKAGLQVDLRILPPESYGAALQYFTGSKAHNIRFRTRAVSRGLRVSEYGVFRVDEAETRIAGREEEDVYAALDLPWMPPELREDRGEIEAAERNELPHLVTVEDLRGDLQMHSTWSDGKNSIEEMLDACVARGYDYFALTDHSKALAMTGGLDAAKLREQGKEIAEIAARRSDIRILKSLEVDILADGQLDLEDEMLEELDVVLVSIHSHLDLARREQTERILKAVQHPAVHILGHPTGRLINRREPMEFDVEEILQCAAGRGVAVELNAHPERLDLKDTHLIRARELGVKVVISTDAHRTSDLDLIRHGVDQARRAWLEPKDVLNTLPADELLQALRKVGR